MYPVYVIDTSGVGAGYARFFTQHPFGVSILLSGLYALIHFYAPDILQSDIGILEYIFLPIVAIVCLTILLAILGFAVSIEHADVRFLYSAGLSYVLAKLLKKTGLIGGSSYGTIIAGILFLVVIVGVFEIIVSRPERLERMRMLIGVPGLILAVYVFFNTLIELTKSAGWIEGGWFGDFRWRADYSAILFLLGVLLGLLLFAKRFIFNGAIRLRYRLMTGFFFFSLLGVLGLLWAFGPDALMSELRHSGDDVNEWINAL
jgi:hypothetical protein